MQKFAKDVRRKERRRDRQNDYQNLRKSLCVGYASQLTERMIRHNGYRTVGFKSQLVQVHPSSVLRTDDEGDGMGDPNITEAREAKRQDTQD
uniref:Probable pre-mRNA-splicing factor ATP-dependent RNA helicase DEAH4 isoform X1 n=1 Tax=Tanacetum cinerariifolium TaxID=118510 RepID=A0A6L2NEW3_TANCI|nr:probable pre-mRNA-splicing factor ATP-dependent RNA helicase DEAH4 isoform X1 [Tanacetum cinerariifolium]